MRLLGWEGGLIADTIKIRRGGRVELRGKTMKNCALFICPRRGFPDNSEVTDSTTYNLGARRGPNATEQSAEISQSVTVGVYYNMGGVSKIRTFFWQARRIPRNREKSPQVKYPPKPKFAQAALNRRIQYNCQTNYCVCRV